MAACGSAPPAAGRRRPAPRCAVTGSRWAWGGRCSRRTRPSTGGTGLVHARQRGITGGHVVDDDPQRAQVEHRSIDSPCPASSSRCCTGAWAGPAPRPQPPAAASAAQPARACSTPPRARCASRPAARHAVVVLGLQEAERQVLQLPLDLPDAQPVGQRREDLLRLLRQRRRAGRLGGGIPAQRLQPRGQAQQHHPQVAREGQQHLAHALGLPARCSSPTCASRARAGSAPACACALTRLA
jgi:hypothetical protein